MRTRFMDIDFFHQKLMVQDDLISKEAPCILRFHQLSKKLFLNKIARSNLCKDFKWIDLE